MSRFHPATVDSVLDDVFLERKRQHERFGQQDHKDGTEDSTEAQSNADITRTECQIATRLGGGRLTWALILKEEVYEALAETDPVRLREELVQVAAVACAWVEAIDRREADRRAKK